MRPYLIQGTAALKELIIDRHGVPVRIRSDPGLEFNNQTVMDFANFYKLKWEFASPRYHETVGAVERANQTVMNILKWLSNFGEKSWQLYLVLATRAYNISFNRAVNTYPYILKFGKDLLIVTDREIQTDEYSLFDLMQKRDQNFEVYKKGIIKGKKTVPYDLEVSEKVLIYMEPRSQKFKDKWYQGFTVKGKVLPDAYIFSKNGKDYRVNKAHIKKIHQNKIFFCKGGSVVYKLAKILPLFYE